MRVLQIGSDRSKRGILYPGSPAYKRQEAYARALGQLDIIAFSLVSDKARFIDAGALRIFPTNAPSKLLYGFYAMHIARSVPKPDVISAQDPFETGLVAWFIAVILRRPLHIQVHTDFLAPGYRKVSSIHALRAILAGFVLRRARSVRVVSERIKVGLVRKYNLRTVTTLPIYADVQRMRVGLANAALSKRFAAYAPKFLVIARLETEKNVQLALRAYMEAAPQSSALIILGDGREREALSRLSERLHSRHVFFEGERDAAPYLAIADLVLVPSLYEGYGLAIIEALAAGKPVLSTDVGIARESGAIVTTATDFAARLRAWITEGPREGVLKFQPYASFEEYVEKYAADIRACASSQ